jgi:microcystin degradation protein MlrC
MRLLIARLSHETNTFSPVPTRLERFCPDRRTLLTGLAAIDHFRGTASPIGGFLAVAEEAGAEIVVPIAAGAPPSGPVESDTYETLCGLITDALNGDRFDGILLDLHGAMVTEAFEDGEGELLRRVAACAPDTPLAVALDMHANLFDPIVRCATVIAGYQTYPHIDQAETALRAGRMLVRAIRGEITPISAWGNAPMLPHVMAQGTHRSPNRELQAMAADLEQSGEALLASVFVGFPHADVSQAGLSAVVVTDGDPAKAQTLVDRLLEAAWAAREAFVFHTEPLESSVARAKQLGAEGGPVVLLDHCDNTASGGTMDTTTVLAEILRQELEDVVFFGICDPDAVQAAMAAGIGNPIELDIGGKLPMPAIPESSAPLRVRGTVRTLSAGYFRSRAPMSRGLKIMLGPTAVIDTGRVEIVLLSRHCEPTDLGLFQLVGIDPHQKRFVAIKSRVHWRADLGSLAKHVVECAGTGVCTSDYGILKFKHVRRPIFPLDPVETRLPMAAQ